MNYSHSILPQTDSLFKLLNRLESVRQTGPNKWVARCPAHPDRSPSLSIRLNGDRILVYCFAGCPANRIVEAVGMTVGDLFLDSPKNAKKKERPTLQLLAAQILEKALVKELENELLEEIKLIERLLWAHGGWQEIMNNSEHADALAEMAHRLSYLDYLWSEFTRGKTTSELIEATKEALVL
ncbi:MAG: hypothetical protein L5655_10835 [Thermosediminibacteraceae bacterium]|nr:hypothetical protein [Thermosediminibacteraceae bacterium]